jgi:hypothetical protein
MRWPIALARHARRAAIVDDHIPAPADLIVGEEAAFHEPRADGLKNPGVTARLSAIGASDRRRPAG